MKKLVFLLSSLLIAMTFAACSNGSLVDDPEQPNQHQDGNPINNSGEDPDEETEGDSDDIRLHFTLLNDSGDKTNIFSEDENIIFDLEIENKSQKDFVYSYNFEGNSDLVLDKDFFCVYTEKGGKIGHPWTGMFCEFSMQKEWVIAAGETYHIRCPWMFTSNYNATHPLCKGDENIQKLSEGSYYTSFSVTYNKLPNEKSSKVTKTFNTKFTIQP